MLAERTATAALSAEMGKAFRKAGLKVNTSTGKPGWKWRDISASRADVTLVWCGADPHMRNFGAQGGGVRMHFLVSIHAGDEMPERALQAIRAHLASASITPVPSVFRKPVGSAGTASEPKGLGMDFGITVTHVDDADVPGMGKWRLNVVDRTPAQLQEVWVALRRRMRPSLVVEASEVMIV